MRNFHSSPISESSTDVWPQCRGTPLHYQFFVHAVMHKNYKMHHVPTYRTFKYSTARISSKYQQSFSITLFCRNTFLLILEASCTKMVICDVPALWVLILKSSHFWGRQKISELWGRVLIQRLRPKLSITCTCTQRGGVTSFWPRHWYGTQVLIRS